MKRDLLNDLLEFARTMGLPIDERNLDLTLQECGIDSMDIIGILARFEARYGQLPRDIALPTLTSLTARQLVNVIESVTAKVA
jgi:acyl carrier protein